MVIVNVVEVDINLLADLVEEAQLPDHIRGYIDLLSDPTFPASPSIEFAVLDAVAVSTAAREDFEASLALVPPSALNDVADAVQAELDRRLAESIVAEFEAALFSALPSAAGF